MLKSIQLSFESFGQFFPIKVTVSRSSNKKVFLQRNFSKIKFKVSYLASSKKLFFTVLSNGYTRTLLLGEVKPILNVMTDFL